MHRRAAVLLLLLASCATEKRRAPPIGEAWVGPSVLKIRQEIDLHSAVVTSARYGDRVEIIQRRRKFLKIRTASGKEGWTEERQLLGAEEMDRLKRLARLAASMPSQGLASTYEVLTVHTGPSRQAPGFAIIKPGEKFDVVAHQAAPRTAPERKPLLPRRPRTARTAIRQKKTTRFRLPPPSPPAAPGPPPDWIELSKTALPPDQPRPEAEPEPMDDWSLVRTPGGDSGWVLTRRLFMAIPDEVAQYAEGRRITSYFPLGDVRDGDKVKRTWLWTTIGGGLQPYDFDSFRVFVWSLRHHRYETAYIQRNLRGYFPVLADAAQPGFSVCSVDRGGPRMRRGYTFVGNSVRLTGEKACEVRAATIEK